MARDGRSVTIVDIARRAGVSKSTVSLVLKASPLVRAETRARVAAAMTELGYVYNRGAASLRRARTGLVGMVINDLSNPFFTELAIGIERALQASGYVPFLANAAESLSRQADVVRAMREHGAAGLILSPAIGTDAAEIERLVGPSFPFVLAIRRVPDVRSALVVSDDSGGAARATAHLIGLGHTAIAFIGGLDGMGVRRDRVAGYRQALAAAQLVPAPDWLVESRPTMDGGAEAMSRLLALPQPPTAAVCFNDVVAIGALHAIARAGRVPGRDVAVVGFDDTREAQLVTPALTTVAIDPPGLGERAAQMLLRQIAEGQRRVDAHVGEARLVVRASCGAQARRQAS